MMRDRIRKWWATPLIIPRWTLTVKYVLFAVLGAMVAWAGLPTLGQATSKGYLSIWAALVMISSIVSAAASVTARAEKWERWSCTSLVAWLVVYLGASFTAALNDPTLGRWSGFVIVLIVTLLPATRATSLLLRTGARRD